MLTNHLDSIFLKSKAILQQQNTKKTPHNFNECIIAIQLKLCGVFLYECSAENLNLCRTLRL